MIFFLNSSGGRMAPYSTYENLWTENAVNETETTSLMVLAEDGELFKHENIIEIPSAGNFVIKEKVNASDGWVEVVGKRHLPGLDVWIENKAYITMTARAMLLDLLEGSGLTLIMPDDLTTKRSVTGTQTSKRQLFFDIIDTFGYEVIIKGQFVYVDEELGEDKGVYATDELNLIDLQTSSDTYDFATRIEPRGQDGMTIASINGGKTYLENHSYSDKIITVYWEDNRYTNKESLRDDAWRKLEVLARPLVTYGAQIIDLARGDESSMWHFNEGDTITLLSSKTGERIKQRAISIRRYPDDPYRNAAVLANRPRSVEIDELENIYSNYEWTKTEINKLGEALELKVSTEKYEQDEETRESLFTSLQTQIQVNKDDISSRVTKEEILTDPDIQESLKGEAGQDSPPSYTWIRYADTPTSGMSNLPVGKDYIGIATNKETETPSNDYSDYLWSLIKGEAGADGNDGNSNFTWIKYADDNKGTGLSDSPEGKRWLGVAANKDTSIESNDWQDYTWSPLYDNSVIMSATAPSSPNIAQLWLDTSVSPNLLKRWDGSKWETISDTTEIEELIASKASQEDIDGQIANVVESIQASLESEISQTNDTINFKFSEAIDAINAAGERITDLSTEIETNIRFTAEGIEIGKTTNPVSVKILPDRVSFSEGGQEVAYFSNNKLYVTDIHVLTSLRIGDFAFFPRSSGNLSFRKVT